MTYQVIVSKKSEKFLEKTEKKWRKKLLTGLKEIGLNPQIGTPLKGELKGKFKYVVWPFRIIYTIEKKEITVYIISIGHRQGVYKKLK